MDSQNTWDQLREDIGIWMEIQFCLNSPRDKEIWQFIIGAAAHLELLAVSVLWKHDGKRVPFDNFQERLTLNQAAAQIEKANLFTPQILQVLKDVAVLRNKVAHRGAAYGVTTGRAQYKGRDVFNDLEALRQLLDDHTKATEGISAWYRANIP
jgi:hypothetical protein